MTGAVYPEVLVFTHSSRIDASQEWQVDGYVHVTSCPRCGREVSMKSAERVSDERVLALADEPCREHV